MTDKKRTADLDWADLRVLLELNRQGSLSATARSLSVTHATIGRRIAKLEATLGHPLFSRQSGRYLLTSEGHRITGLAGPMEECALAVARAAAGLQPELTGPVRITATESVFIHIIMPALGEIRARHPGLDLELRISDKKLSLARRDADIAIRLARPDPQSQTENHFMTLSRLAYHLYGSSLYLENHKGPDHDFIGYPEEQLDRPEPRILASLIGNGRIVLRINHLSSRIAATCLGVGLSLIPRVMAEACRELQRVSSGPPVMHRDINLLVHPDMRGVPRIKACIDVLAEVIAGRANLLT